jgi:predicted DCC family thiol-disulfide oxidoreductase YuxK
MHTILFDGVCNLCNASVNFIIDRDKHNKFKFAALQSESGLKLINQYKIVVPENDYDSLILIKANKVYKKSTAALKIAKELSGLWPLFYIFILIPASIRDIFYTLIARNRYRLFGRSDTCRLPGPELNRKFI